MWSMRERKNPLWQGSQTSPKLLEIAQGKKKLGDIALQKPVKSKKNQSFMNKSGATKYRDFTREHFMTNRPHYIN
ncbi:hypothetical protein [Tepidimonas taiwanensis]|uniref:hypothetical protein n=1 Tax=Tepidimonas taiwanensis TaxID=307486 RepID=UPI00117CFB78|nr:hypothetical protein [Tepidimonas taiwanensis]